MITLIILFLVIIGVIPMIGITKKHNQIALETGVVCQADVNLDGVEVTAPDFTQLRPLKEMLRPWNS